MLRRLRDYESFEVWSRDGRDLGGVEDFYFDELQRVLRHSDEVKGSPEYDPAADIDGKYEEQLAEAFRRPVRRS